jgi:hypothetical protein
MKPLSDERNDILAALARKGDPTAVFGLFKSEFLATYLHLCSNEKPSETVWDELESFIRALYGRCRAIPLHSEPSEWYKGLEKKYLTDTGVPDDVQSLEGVTAEHVRELYDRIQRLLLREYGIQRRKGHRAPIKGLKDQRPTRASLWPFFAGGAVALLLCAAVLLGITIAGNGLTIHIGSRENVYTVSLFSNDAASFERDREAISSTAVDSSIVTDTMTDTVKKSMNVQTEPAKMRSAPQRTTRSQHHDLPGREKREKKRTPVYTSPPGSQQTGTEKKVPPAASALRSADDTVTNEAGRGVEQKKGSARRSQEHTSTEVPPPPRPVQPAVDVSHPPQSRSLQDTAVPDERKKATPLLPENRDTATAHRSVDTIANE